MTLFHNVWVRIETWQKIRRGKFLMKKGRDQDKYAKPKGKCKTDS